MAAGVTTKKGINFNRKQSNRMKIKQDKDSELPYSHLQSINQRKEPIQRSVKREKIQQIKENSPQQLIKLEESHQMMYIKNKAKY